MDDPPAALGVPIVAGRESVIATFDLPYCLYLTDGVYAMNTAAGPVEVQLTKRWREREENFENVEIQNDPIGQYRYTSVRMALTLAPEDEAEVVVLATINRLVDVYRYVTGRAYLHPLQISDLVDLVVERPSKHEGQVFFAFGGGGLGMAYPDDTGDVHREVARLLDADDPIPLHAELLLTARRLAIGGYTRQAVIDAVAALEVFVEELLRARLTAKGKPPADVDTVLDRERIGDLMKKPMEDAIGWRVSSDVALWADWLRVNGVRRGATHRGAVVAPEAAVDAVDVVERVIAAVIGNS